MVVFTYNLGDAVGWLLIGVLLFLTYLGMVFVTTPSPKGDGFLGHGPLAVTPGTDD